MVLERSGEDATQGGYNLLTTSCPLRAALLIGNMAYDTKSRENLLAIAKAYAKAEKIRLSVVSRRIYKNSDFFADLRDGGNVTIKTVEHALKWFRSHWPERADWPMVPAIYMDRDEKK